MLIILYIKGLKAIICQMQMLKRNFKKKKLKIMNKFTYILKS